MRHRIASSIAWRPLVAAFEPTRRIVFARELTKLFETIHRCALGEAMAWLEGDPNRERGEFVVLLEGAPPAGDEDDAEADRILGILLAECSVKQAAALGGADHRQEEECVIRAGVADERGG